MQIEVIQTPEDLLPITAEWNELLSQSATNVPFLRQEYALTWWAQKGGGEWDAGELYVVVARDDEGKLVGIAPLFFIENLDGVPALMLIGSIEISDFLDVIVKPEDQEAFLGALAAHLSSAAAPAWKALDFYNVLKTSETLPILEKLAGEHGWAYQQEVYKPAPYIALPADWDSYLAMLDKRDRKKLSRVIRMADHYHIPVSMYTVEDPNILDAELDDFFALMTQDAEKNAFLTDPMQAQMRAIAHTALEHGWLHLVFVQAGNKKVAAQYDFDYDNRIWAYNSGFSLEDMNLSPGLVLSGKIIQWCIENGRSAFDFMRGDEEYKYSFGAEDRYVMRVQVTR
ncbi:MAG: GNAT family N-acetyltransferase [Anaerolineales bacterium]|nr:GNAT family N-acetyltransferase [Anaerolineales bacterium]